MKRNTCELVSSNSLMPANAIVPVNHSKIDLHFLFVKILFPYIVWNCDCSGIIVLLRKETRQANRSKGWKTKRTDFSFQSETNSAATSQGAAALKNVAIMKRVSSSILKQLARSSERTVAMNRSSSLLRCLSRIVSMSKDRYTS